MDFKKLHQFVTDKNLPQFREKQIRRAFFVGLANDWNEVTVLSKDLREELEREIPFSSVKEERFFKKKKDDSVKVSLKLENGDFVETVLIKHKDGRRTVCVSSQVGCSMACAFCATGQSGFKRDLEADEIVDQVIFFARFLKSMDEKVTNIVFMGMGEPLLNYDNVLRAIKVLNDKEGFNLGARHMSISTCGIVPGIEKLAKEKLQINLALSMHAPTDTLRGKFMPINARYNIEEALKAVDDYIRKTNRRVMIEYLLIKNLNDKEEDAEKLSEIFKTRSLCYINLIPYNATDSKFLSSPRENIQKFANVLRKNKIKYTIRHSFGGAIEAACGQLARKTWKT